jgi:hypothetical protein
MATVKEALTLKFQTTKDGEVEETQLAAGDELTVVQTWDRFYLVKDDNGHYYNVPKDKLTP